MKIKLGSSLLIVGLFFTSNLTLASVPASVNGTTVTTSATDIVDAGSNVWTLGSGTTAGLIYKNKIKDPTSFNVKLLLYFNNTVYQENTSGNWYSYNGSSWTRVTSGSPIILSSSGATIPTSNQLVVSSLNIWALGTGTIAGYIYKGGVKDPSSFNVKLLLFYNDILYQENTSGNWYQYGGSTWARISGDPRSAGLTAPTEASAAGFTTLAANYDFSQPLYATQANWLDCNNNNNSLPWHAGNPGIFLSLPCNINQTTDAETGTKVMDFQYLTSYNSKGLSGQSNTVGAQTYNIGTKTATATFPNMYAEAIYREKTDWPAGNNLSGGPDGVWTWGDGSEVIELDIGELYQDQGGFSDSGAVNWSNSAAKLGYFFTSYGTNHLPKGYKVTAYHKYGMLLTSNGKTGSYSCSFVDDILQECKNMKIISASAYTTRNWLIASVTSLHPPALADIDMLVQYIRVWSCADWKTGMCNGTTLYGPDTTGREYWH